MRYGFFDYKAPGESGIGFFEIDGFGKPVKGVCFCPDPIYGGATMDEYHHGWMLPAPIEGHATPHPCTDNLSSTWAEKMLVIADEAITNIRRRTEDAIRKGGPIFVLRAAEAVLPHPSHFYPHRYLRLFF